MEKEQKKEPILASSSIIFKILITSFLSLITLSVLVGGILLYNKRPKLSPRVFWGLISYWLFLAAIIVSLIIFSIFKLLNPIKLLASKKELSEEATIYSKEASSSISAQEIYFSFEKLTESLGSSQLLTELRNPAALEELCLKGHSINNRGIYELTPELSKLPKLKKLTMDFGDIAEAQLLQYLPELYKLEQLEALRLIGLDTEGAGRIGLGLNNFPRLTFLQIGAYIDASSIEIICKSLEEPQCKIIECNVNYGVKNYNQEQVDRAIAARIAKASKPTGFINCAKTIEPKRSELALLI